jgi:hypothetical protein
VGWGDTRLVHDRDGAADHRARTVAAGEPLLAVEGGGILLAGGGRVVGQRRHRGTGWDGPLWGAREGDRCALALISLALDEGDATAVIGGRRRS